MQTNNNRLLKVSRAVLRHPLLTAAGFVLFVTFTRLSGTKALVGSVVVIGLVILPIIGWNYRNTQKGRYSNFDVSIRSQRHSFYRVSVGLLLLATGVLWLTGQPPALRYGMGFALLLVVLSGLANLYIKASLHTSVSVFLSLALEIGAGAAIGLAVGGSLYSFMKHAAPLV